MADPVGNADIGEEIAPPPPQTCAGCGAWDADGFRLQCPQCLERGISDKAFCSKACFKKAWKGGHKTRYHTPYGPDLVAAEAHNDDPALVPLLSLPEEVITCALAYASVADLCRLRGTCRLLSRVAMDSFVWKDALAGWSLRMAALNLSAGTDDARLAALRDTLDSVASLLGVRAVHARYARYHLHLVCEAARRLAENVNQVYEAGRAANFFPDRSLVITLAPQESNFATPGEIVFPYVSWRVMHGGNRRVWSDVVHPSEDDSALVDGWVVALARNRQAELGDFSVSPAHQKNIMEFHVMFPAVRSLTIGRTNSWWHPSELKAIAESKAAQVPVRLLAMVDLEVTSRPSYYYSNSVEMVKGRAVPISKGQVGIDSFLKRIVSISAATLAHYGAAIPPRYLKERTSTRPNAMWATMEAADLALVAANGGKPVDIDSLLRSVEDALGCAITQQCNGVHFAVALIELGSSTDVLATVLSSTALGIVVEPLDTDPSHANQFEMPPATARLSPVERAVVISWNATVGDIIALTAEGPATAST